MSKKYCLYLTHDEWRLIIKALNDWRNELIIDGRYTDPIDEALIKLMQAPHRKTKIVTRNT